MPVMSLGIRSGVNWMRLKSSDSDCASECTIKVLASPGTPSRMQCPRAKTAISSCSTTSSWPTICRLAICRARISARETTLGSCKSSFAVRPEIESHRCYGRFGSECLNDRLSVSFLESMT